jgi:lysozyme family protein
MPGGTAPSCYGTVVLALDKMRGDDFPLQDLADIVCDFYVNSGTHATVLLQRVLNGMGAHVVEDGSIGPGSIQALNGFDQAEVYRQYKQGRISYYQNLGQRFPQFVKGWLNRVNAFPNL